LKLCSAARFDLWLNRNLEIRQAAVLAAFLNRLLGRRSLAQGRP
jgi:hypothetical protein